MGIVFCFLINGKMDGHGRYQASTLELDFVNDVELMLQQIQKALEMSDKVVSKLESVKDDEVTNMFEQMAQSQILLANELLKIQTNTNFVELIGALELFADILKKIAEITV